jgi:methyl-accepting chemotaxis protein
MSISKQILFTTTALVFIAFSATAFFVYQQASNLLLDNELHANQSKIEILAESLAGRFESVKEIAHTQVKTLKANQFPQLQRTEVVEQIGEQKFFQLIQYDTSIIEQNQLMDDFNLTTGSHATLFSMHDKKFVRVVTSLTNQSGKRAIGTTLGSEHPGYSALIRGDDFSNAVTLFGKRYLAYYHPLKNQLNEVYGIIFVGLPMAKVIQDITDSLENIVWGKTGYSIVLDAAKGHEGTFLFHNDQSLIGKKVQDVVAADGSKPFNVLFEQPSGLLHYSWDNQGKPQEKFLVYAYVPGWEWKLMGGAFISEVMEVTDVSVTLLWQICAIAAIAGSIIVFLLFLLLRSILRPLSRLTEQVEAFGQGEISQVIDNVDATSHNEIHCLATDLANMGRNLLELVKQMKQSGGQLSTTALSLRETSDHSCRDLEIMGQQTNQLASAIEEMTVSVSSVAEQASAIASEMHTAKEEADRSGETVGQMMEGMVELDENISRSSNAIREVAKQGDNIESVTKLIDEIAEQTNLLALNAAIEAARAGEQGRGFSVVADEVRQLAHRTQQSVKNVVEIITQLQNSTRTAVALMDKSQTMGATVTQRAKETGSTLEAIITQINTIAMMSDSIATTAEEQAQVSQELAVGVTQIRDLSERNLDGALQTVNGAEAVNQESISLNEQVAYFH